MSAIGCDKCTYKINESCCRKSKSSRSKTELLGDDYAVKRSLQHRQLMTESEQQKEKPDAGGHRV